MRTTRYIEFIQPHRPEEAMPDSYKCEPVFRLTSSFVCISHNLIDFDSVKYFNLETYAYAKYITRQST